jgi:hypothetical protein
MPRKRFRIVLEAIESPDDPPPPVRLRMLLKKALRAFGLRCVRAEEIPQPPLQITPEESRLPPVRDSQSQETPIMPPLTTAEIVAAVAEMRRLQKAYFRGRRELLEQCKLRERAVDEIIKRFEESQRPTEPSLFGPDLGGEG